MSFDYKTMIYSADDIAYIIQRMDDKINELSQKAEELERENEELKSKLEEWEGYF